MIVLRFVNDWKTVGRGINHVTFYRHFAIIIRGMNTEVYALLFVLVPTSLGILFILAIWLKRGGIF